jgi:hypothetical protein
VVETGGTFLRWTVNGTDQATQSPPDELALTNAMTKSGQVIVRAVFSTTWTVTTNANSGEGSLRDVLGNKALDGDTIILPAGATIALDSSLSVSKSLTINGNGATLTRSSSMMISISPLLNIPSNAANQVLTISRLHFKGGRTISGSAAIDHTGSGAARLTLESCIFSDNRVEGSSVHGGAISFTSSVGNGVLTMSGCTFYGNVAKATAGTGSGGAIYVSGNNNKLALTGNIFVENTVEAPMTPSNPVVHVSRADNVSSDGYNVSDKADGYTINSMTLSGWAFATGDKADVQRTDVQFDTTFKPSSTTGLPQVPSGLQNFPTLYFDGSARVANGAPGAMPAQ